jgi:hypothetical protein
MRCDMPGTKETKTYWVTIHQVYCYAMDIEATSEEEARQKVQAKIDADDWDEPWGIDGTEIDIVLKSELG